VRARLQSEDQRADDDQHAGDVPQTLMSFTTHTDAELVQ